MIIPNISYLNLHFQAVTIRITYPSTTEQRHGLLIYHHNMSTNLP